MKTFGFLVFFAIVLVIGLTLCVACGDDDDDDDNDDDDDDDGTFILTSSAFDDGGNIPEKYSCDGDNTSPPLSWSGAPEGTEYFAITVRDPDGGDAQHWALINIPGDSSSLDEGISPGSNLPEGTWETLNYTDQGGWAGPCPPEDDDPHGYIFTLYALNAEVAAPGTSVYLNDAEPWIEAAAIATTTLTGMFAR
jgi:Raf kinase inhibitor-like YbhB/YbcL family protein